MTFFQSSTGRFGWAWVTSDFGWKECTVVFCCCRPSYSKFDILYVPEILLYSPQLWRVSWVTVAFWSPWRYLTIVLVTKALLLTGYPLLFTLWVINWFYVIGFLWKSQDIQTSHSGTNNYAIVNRSFWPIFAKFYVLSCLILCIFAIPNSFS